MEKASENLSKILNPKKKKAPEKNPVIEELESMGVFG